MKDCHLHLSAVFYLVIGPEIFAVEVTMMGEIAISGSLFLEMRGLRDA